MDSASELVTLLKENFCPNVYLQPGDDVHLNYPCIVLNPTGVFDKAANAKSMYVGMVSYQMTYMAKRRDFSLTQRFMRELPYCRLTSYFVSNGVYHDVYTIYYKL